MAMRILILLQKLVGMLVLLGFLLGVLLLLFAPYELYRAQQARDWPYREGIISQSTIHQTSGRRRTWQPLLRGQFVDNGESFVITRIRYGDFLFGESHSRRLIQPYPIGSHVKVYYDPEQPNERILDSQAPYTPGLLALSIGAGLVAMPFVLYGWGRWRSKRQQR